MFDAKRVSESEIPSMSIANRHDNWLAYGRLA